MLPVALCMNLFHLQLYAILVVGMVERVYRLVCVGVLTSGMEATVRIVRAYSLIVSGFCIHIVYGIVTCEMEHSATTPQYS